MVVQVLDRVTCCFSCGQVTAVVGPSGCGKTTLLNVLAGLVEPQEGEVHTPSGDGHGRRAGYVFQSPSLIPWLSVRRNALFGAEVGRGLDAAVELRCGSLLNRFGLRGFSDAFPRALSGGMQQRVALARAVLAEARVILLDEPFSGTDYLLKWELEEELSQVVDEEALVAVLVTHDLDEAARLADKVVVLSVRPGRVKAQIEIDAPRASRLQRTGESTSLIEFWLQRIVAAVSSRDDGSDLASVQ